MKPVIILVNPQLGENIGAAARVMSNFGIDELRIVNPRDGWPNAKAYEMAANGSFVLDKATIYEDCLTAVADINLLFATSALKREMNKKIISSDQLPTEIANYNSGNKVGFLFGRERSGLTNEELALADRIVKIPVSTINPSLNLAQAVAIVCYELSKVNEFEIDNVSQKLALKGDLDFLIKTIEIKLLQRGFLKENKLKPSMLKNITNIFTRAELTEQDVRTLQGMLRAILDK